MALIYRSVFEVKGDAIGEEASSIFRSWLAGKALRDGVDASSLDTTGPMPEPVDLGPWEIELTEGKSGDLSALLARLTEQKADQVLATTFRVVGCQGAFWSSIDLEREWKDGGEFGASWVPSPPGIVRDVLSAYECTQGSTRLDGQVHIVSRENVGGFLERMKDPAREVPFVVVTRSKAELNFEVTDGAPARAGSLASRLAGVAEVALFEPLVAQDFSAGVGGAPWDVHSGAVRTFLPGLLKEDDYPQRHRTLHFKRLDGAHAGTAARLVAWRLIEAGTHRKLPQSWAQVLNEVPEFSVGRPERDWEEYAGELDEKLTTALGKVADLKEELLLVQGEAREDVATALVAVERLQARERYLRDELQAARPELDIGDALHITEETTANREYCATVVNEAQVKLPNVVFFDIERVMKGAELLDEHGESSFAMKGWQVLSALNEFAEANASGSFEGSFRDFCQRSASTKAVQPNWVRMKESKTTDRTPRYREARTFKVPDSVDASGSVYMDAHVALEAGGYPAPRIHFHDDTRGSGKIYVGWFGPHLDNKSKN